MRKVIFVPIRCLINMVRALNKKIDKLYCQILFIASGVNFHDFTTVGVPHLTIVKKGHFFIGKHFEMINTTKGNPIGRTQRCSFFVDKGATIRIGDRVGISSAAFFAQTSIIIGNDVKIGGGVCIYDTDFHSVNPELRKDRVKDRQNQKMLPVEIKDNAFIGAHSTILKGSIIGKNSVIGACSVVTKSVPDNEIWAGNPAHFIRVV
jgi:acetyltransferase-like isoleucine patch superfamily enzyme